MPVMAELAHPECAMPYYDLEGRVSATLAFTDSAAQTAAVVPEGVYEVYTSKSVYLKVAPDASGVDNTGFLLLEGTTRLLLIRKDCKIGALRVTDNGTLRYHKVG